MSQSTSLPQSIATRLNKTVQLLHAESSESEKLVALKNALNIIALMVAATSASLLKYDESSKHSTVICEYDSRRSGILERRIDSGERYDERQFRILFKWIQKPPHQPLMLHVDQLPTNSSERREFQKYAIHSAIYLPILGAENELWGYIELWESRYKRIYNEQELADLLQATRYVTKIINA